MKTEEGIVIEVVGNVAKVKASKHNECKECGACPGNDSAIVTAKNKVIARPGQKVFFEVEETNTLIGAFIVFILPLVLVTMGVTLGWVISNSIGMYGVVCKIAGGIVAFLLAVAFIKAFDNHVGKNENSLPIITRIVH